MNNNKNHTRLKLDENLTLVQNLDDLRTCLNLLNSHRKGESGISDAGFTDDLANAVKDPALELVAGAWGFMGNMFSKFENLAEAMLDTTAALIVTLRICAVVAIVIITIIIIWKVWSTCNKCTKPCTKPPKKSSQDDHIYSTPIINSSRGRRKEDIVR